MFYLTTIMAKAHHVWGANKKKWHCNCVIRFETNLESQVESRDPAHNSNTTRWERGLRQELKKLAGSLGKIKENLFPVGLSFCWVYYELPFHYFNTFLQYLSSLIMLGLCYWRCTTLYPTYMWFLGVCSKMSDTDKLPWCNLSP